jgi:hypothetical protein
VVLWGLYAFALARFSIGQSKLERPRTWYSDIKRLIKPKTRKLTIFFLEVIKIKNKREPPKYSFSPTSFVHLLSSRNSFLSAKRETKIKIKKRSPSLFTRRKEKKKETGQGLRQKYLRNCCTYSSQPHPRWIFLLTFIWGRWGKKKRLYIRNEMAVGYLPA